MSKRFKIIVCRGPECGDKRHSSDVHAAFQRALPPPGTLADPAGGPPVEVVLDRHSCFGRCQRGVNVLVREIRPGENAFMLSLMPTSAPGAVLYHGVRPDEIRRILDEHVLGGRPVAEFIERGAAIAQEAARKAAVLQKKSGSGY